jgi:hypothetical protein
MRRHLKPTNKSWRLDETIECQVERSKPHLAQPWVRTPPKSTRQAKNPLNSKLHRQPPPKVGRHVKIWQNWRPGEKMLGPDGIQALHVWFIGRQAPCARVTAVPLPCSTAGIDL